MSRAKTIIHWWRNNSWQRGIIFATVGAGITFLFAVFNGVFSLLYRSSWYGVFAGYYLILAVQKVLLLVVYGVVWRKFADDPVCLTREKQKIYLANGAILVPVAVALAMVVSVLVHSPQPTAMDEIMAITAATYAFYKITVALINLVKAKQWRDPLWQTLRNLALVEALVSMLTLESTLITTFGELTHSLQMVIGISGLVVCAFVIGLGSYMLVRGIRWLRSHFDNK